MRAASNIRDRRWQPAFSLLSPLRDRHLEAATHEAGHAAGYLHYGYPFRSVEINGDVGLVEVTGLCRDPGNYAVIALCGPAAEARFIGATITAVLAGSGRFDLQNARRALTHMKPRAPSLQWVQAAARRVVDSEWAIITLIARALMRHGRLDYAEVEELVTAALNRDNRAGRHDLARQDDGCADMAGNQ